MIGGPNGMVLSGLEWGKCKGTGVLYRHQRAAPQMRAVWRWYGTVNNDRVEHWSWFINLSFWSFTRDSLRNIQTILGTHWQYQPDSASHHLRPQETVALGRMGSCLGLLKFWKWWNVQRENSNMRSRNEREGLLYHQKTKELDFLRHPTQLLHGYDSWRIEKGK